MTYALSFRDLTLGYDRTPAVYRLDGEIAAGSLTAVVGPNGAGKSTLLKGVVGTIRPLAGQVGFGTFARSDIAYLPAAVGHRSVVPAVGRGSGCDGALA